MIFDLESTILNMSEENDGLALYSHKPQG